MPKKTKEIERTTLTQGVDLRDWLKGQPKKFQTQVWVQYNKKEKAS